MRLRLCLLCATLLLGGCRTDLYSKVSEQEANEIVAALAVNGIDAGKRSVDGKTWSVQVDEGEVADAVEVLRERGLPRERYQSIGEVFKREGLVSTPSEERIRFIYAMSQELSRTLSEISGVVGARVHVVIPANDPLAENPRASSASVFIKHAPGVDTQAITPAIKNLVTRSIEGLSYDNVSVSFFVAERAPERKLPKTRSAATTQAVYLVAVSALLAMLSLGVLVHRPARRVAGQLAGRILAACRSAVRARAGKTEGPRS